MSRPIGGETVTAEQVIAALEALRGVIAEVRVNGVPLGRSVRYESGAATGDPIEVNIAPPTLMYQHHGRGPSFMLVDVFVVAVQGDLTVHNMLALERGVADAIDTSPDVDATVRSSTPGIWRRGTTDLPAYIIEVEVGLP